MYFKSSRYNFYIVDENGSRYIYNSLSNCLSQLDEPEVWEPLYSNSLMNSSIKYFNELLTQHFIVPDYVNELEMIKYFMYKDRFDNSFFKLGIIPTYDCNFACTYCYQQANGNHSSAMNKETIANLLRYVEDNLKKCNGLSVLWYGGEPLIKFDLIKELSTYFMEMSAKENKQYRASMITNGALLSDAVIEDLRNFRITDLQITLDGLPERHNQYRKTKNGSPTFDVVWENISRIPDDFVVNVRVNADEKQLADVDKIITMFANDNLKHINLYFGRIVPEIEQINQHHCCISNKNFAFESLKINQKLYANGFKVNFLPIRKRDACPSSNLYSKIIDPSGKIFNCLSDIIREDCSIGNLHSSSVESEYFFNANLYKKMLFEPWDNPECSECKILPLCFGSCPAKKRVNEQDYCNPLKYTLHDTILTYIKVLSNIPLDKK